MNEHYSSTLAATSTKSAPPTQLAPLDQIVARIRAAERGAQEIGNKLHNHADLVHGSEPTSRGPAPAPDEPNSAMGRIWQALDALDDAQSYMAEGAGRNCTLA